MNTEIKDTEIRIVGGDDDGRNPRRRWRLLAAALLTVAAVAAATLLLTRKSPAPTATDSIAPTTHDDSWLVAGTDTTRPNIYHMTVGIDTTLLHIYLPLQCTAELAVGSLDTTDGSILMALQAADLRRDNGRIVGAFVRGGEPLSWGLSKRGYCAIIDGTVTLGAADNSPLFEQATETGGDFFRQYPAVANNQAVANNPENSALRRALCLLEGHLCVICSDERLTMNTFANTLETLGVDDAIFLVGGSADGWVRRDDSTLQRLGPPAPKKRPFTNYMVFRRQ